jgi:hypothetical protein
MVNQIKSFDELIEQQGNRANGLTANFTATTLALLFY